MNDTERWDLMKRALRESEKRIERERFDQTGRGLVYLDDGMPFEQLLEGLGISRSTWFRRVAEYRGRYSGGA